MSRHVAAGGDAAAAAQPHRLLAARAPRLDRMRVSGLGLVLVLVRVSSRAGCQRHAHEETERGHTPDYGGRFKSHSVYGLDLQRISLREVRRKRGFIAREYRLQSGTDHAPANSIHTNVAIPMKNAAVC